MRSPCRCHHRTRQVLGPPDRHETLFNSGHTSAAEPPPPLVPSPHPLQGLDVRTWHGMAREAWKPHGPGVTFLGCPPLPTHCKLPCAAARARVLPLGRLEQSRRGPSTGPWSGPPASPGSSPAPPSCLEEHHQQPHLASPSALRQQVSHGEGGRISSMDCPLPVAVTPIKVTEHSRDECTLPSGQQP